MTTDLAWWPPAIDQNILSPTEQESLHVLWQYFSKYPAPAVERINFKNALTHAFKLHTLTRRKSGESYFIHDLRCAVKSLIMGCELDMSTIMLAHEFQEDNDWSNQKLRRLFGYDIAYVVMGLSKPPPIFPTREERIDQYLKNMARAIVKHNSWKILLGKVIDRHDNARDTAGLDAATMQQLFLETEQKMLPFFQNYIDYIPPQHLPFYRWLLYEIDYACQNYKQAVRNQSPS